MTIHQYLMRASMDDARRAGERDRVLLEARRLGLTRPPGAGVAAILWVSCGPPRVVTAPASRDRGTSHSRAPARPHRQDNAMYTHPDNAASLDRDRHRAMRADIGSHRLARQLRDLARAARRARTITPHRLRRAWRPVPRLRAPG